MKVFPHLLNVLSAASIVSGLTIGALQTSVLANLTAPGALVPASDVSLHKAAEILPIAYQTADVGLQLIIGMLLILLGCFLHAWARMHSGERSVHITVKPTKKRQMWFWVDLHI